MINQMSISKKGNAIIKKDFLSGLYEVVELCFLGFLEKLTMLRYILDF